MKTNEPLLARVRNLLDEVEYGEWLFRVAAIGDGAYIQVILDELDDHGKPWTGRKFYVSSYATDSEIVATAFKAVTTAEEHETREKFLYKGLPIYGPHQSLEALMASARLPEDHRG